jgi:raffinose/stachyose/melibiose transport system permease protein
MFKQFTKNGFLNSATILNIMYLPALAFFVMFIFYPFIMGIQISFTDWDGFNKNFNYVGFEKYKSLLDRNVYISLLNTFIYGVGSTLFQNIAGLLYALFLDSNLKIRGIVRTIIFLPIIIAPLIMGYIWYFFFQYDGGAVNDILKLLNKDAVDWLANRNMSVWIITFVNTFQYLGISMVIYLAGLQAIPKDYYEAAAIDGARAFSRFRNIILPLLMPSITVNIVINLIGGLKLFDVIVAMTNGGPGYQSSSLSVMMYNLRFASQDAGKAAALGNLMFIIICICSIYMLVNLRKREVEM